MMNQRTGRQDTAQASSSPPVSYSGQLYTYLYNGAASFSNAVHGEVKLSDDVPCFVDGACYTGPKTTLWASQAVHNCAYFTYRKGLPMLLCTGGDHDAGWGCMIRTGQMMLCQSLRRLFRCDESLTTDPLEFAMFRNQRESSFHLSPPQSPRRQVSDSAPLDLSEQQSTTADSKSGRGSIFQWVQEFFMDTPQAPFGLYKMTNEGAKMSVPVGSWFSPTILARTIESLCKDCPQVCDRLCVIAALDQSVSQEQILRCINDEEQSVLLLVPLMLGLGTVGKSYEQVILRLLELESCVGLVGGKPQKSLYFIGHQGDNVFYLDPHVVQPAFTSYATVGKIGGPRGTTPVSSLDPCLLSCFLFDREESFLSWCDGIAIINRLGEFPIISVAQGSHGPSSLTVLRHSPASRLVDPCDFDVDEDDLL